MMAREMVSSPSRSSPNFMPDASPSHSSPNFMPDAVVSGNFCFLPPPLTCLHSLCTCPHDAAHSPSSFCFFLLPSLPKPPSPRLFLCLFYLSPAALLSTPHTHSSPQPAPTSNGTPNPSSCLPPCIETHSSRPAHTPPSAAPHF